MECEVKYRNIVYYLTSSFQYMTYFKLSNSPGQWQKISKLINSRNKTQITETEFVTSDLYFTAICYFIRVLVTPLIKSLIKSLHKIFTFYKHH